MLDINVARKALEELRGYASGSNGEDAAAILEQFIARVEMLHKNRYITYPAALLMPPMKGY